MVALVRQCLNVHEHLVGQLIYLLNLVAGGIAEVIYLIRDNGKALARLPCPGSLYGSVQRKEIRLACYGADRLRHIHDLLYDLCAIYGSLKLHTAVVCHLHGILSVLKYLRNNPVDPVYDLPGFSRHHIRLV